MRFGSIILVGVALAGGCGGSGAAGDGDPGQMGAPGATGPIGPAGAQGPAGPNGPSGPAGPMGPAGAEGSQGPQGVTGPAGAMGSLGLTGAAGPAGANGVAGAPGPTGPQGPAGTIFGEEASAFAAFTTVTVTGAAGGREALNAACAAVVPNSHLCHYAEYELAASSTTVPAQSAWIDQSCTEQYAGDSLSSGLLGWGFALATVDSGAYVDASSTSNCANWTSSTGTGAIIGDTTSIAACNVARPVACCNTPYREKFRGYTTPQTTGAAGGRAAMHGRCAAQFAGSHLCHLAEYERGHSTITPPAAGAWLDDSTWKTVAEDRCAVPRSGRNTNPMGECDSWTAASGTTGLVLSVGGVAQGDCGSAHVLACCGG